MTLDYRPGMPGREVGTALPKQSEEDYHVSKTITFSTFTGYALPYEQIVTFCSQHGKGVPPRERLRGPTCIVAEFELRQDEKEALARHPQVCVHERIGTPPLRASSTPEASASTSFSPPCTTGIRV